MMRTFLFLAVMLLACAGCEEHRAFIDAGGGEHEYATRSEAVPDAGETPAPQTAHGCADGHCWRIVGTGEYMNRDGTLLPPPRDAQVPEVPQQ